MKLFGIMWFIILLDKSTVLKDGLIGSPLNETNFRFEFTVPIFASLYSKTFLNSAPRLGSVQEPEETHLELYASFNSALPGDFPFTCFNWYRNGPSKVHQDNHKLFHGNYEKEGDCFARMRERKLICNWLACIQLLFLPFLCNLIKKSDFIKTKLALKNCEKTFLKNIF